MKKNIKASDGGQHTLSNLFMISRKSKDAFKNEYEDGNVLYLFSEMQNYTQSDTDYVKDYDRVSRGINMDEINMSTSEYYACVEGMPKIVGIDEINGTEKEIIDILEVEFSDGRVRKWVYNEESEADLNRIKEEKGLYVYDENLPAAQIIHVVKTQEEGYQRLIEVTYEVAEGHQIKIKFSKDRFESRIKQLKEDQEYVQSLEYSRYKSRKKAFAIIGGITGLAILSGAIMWLSTKFGPPKKPEEPDVSPTFVPTASATFKAEATPTLEPTAVPTATPEPTATAVPTPTATPEPSYETGESFVAELEAKGYEYLINGDEVKFGPDEAEKLFSLLETGDYEGFSSLSDMEKKQAIIDYQNMILLYCAGSINPTTEGPVDFSKKFKMTEQQNELLRNLSNMARKIGVLSVDQPINGKVIDSEKETGKFSDEYLSAASDFLAAQAVMLEGNQTYDESNPWFKYLVSSLVVAANHEYLPEYFYSVDPETGKNKYMVYFEYTNQEGETSSYIPIITQNGVRYKPEAYINDPQVKGHTYEEMMSYTDSNSSKYTEGVKLEGIAKETFGIRTTADEAICDAAGVTIEKDHIPGK